jgi:outer membrane lipoprotein carrier protein
MFKKIQGMLVLLALAVTMSPASAEQQLAQAVDVPNISSSDEKAPGKLNALLENTKSFSANFTQKLHKPKAEKDINYTGRFSLKRPNRFRWEVTSPDKQLLVADGKDLWFYDEDLQQVTVTPIGEAIGSTPAALLSSSTIDVNKNFFVMQTVDTEKTQQFQLNPKRSDQLITKIKITFENKVLTEMEVTDSTDQRSVIHFSNVKMNPGLSDSLFTYKVPAGVDVIGKKQKK